MQALYIKSRFSYMLVLRPSHMGLVRPTWPRLFEVASYFPSLQLLSVTIRKGHRSLGTFVWSRKRRTVPVIERR